MTPNLARFFDLSIDLLCIADLEGRFTLLNPAWEATLGWTREELTGRPFLDFVHPDDVAATLQAMEKLKQGQKILSFENRYRGKDGQYRWFAWTSSPVPEEGVTYAIARDITARRLAEDGERLRAGVEVEVRDRSTEELRRQNLSLGAQLLQAQKMEAVGRLAGGIAHDFNNVLTVIIGFSEMLASSLAPGQPMKSELEEINRAGERAAGLTRQLLAFSRQQVLEPRILDLNEVVRGIEKMIRRILGEDISLVFRTAPGLCPVKADPGQIEQVIMNLIVNARDAMPQGGRLTIETANIELDDAYAAEHLDARAGPHAMLAVSDTGVGMNREIQSRIFEPFFTTKAKGSGTGLGLATVFGIVKQSGGNIWVYSEPDQGATFKIYLPRAEGLPPAAPTLPALPRPGGLETILLVEDDDGVRNVARTILRANGYQVLEAKDSDEALGICEQHPHPIHLLLTDVVMPLMSGPRLADRLAATRPDMRLLCMSGYTDEAVVHHGLIDAGVAFIQKPLTPDQLSKKVREVLDGPR